MDIEKLKFPIGIYEPIKDPNTAQIKVWIECIEGFPNALAKETSAITEKQKQWQYRPGGWNIKQVVHHCADSHMNSIIRFKLALTEDTPTIRPYFEDRWAALEDGTQNDISDSITLLTALHKKWGVLLRSLNANQLQLEYIHPEHGQRFNLAETIGTYAWHCNHHLTHVKNAIASNGMYTT